MTRKRMSPGDPVGPFFSARRHNALNDLLSSAELDSGARGDGTEGRANRSTQISQITNASGVDVPVGGVLGIDGFAFDADANENEFRAGDVDFKGVKPTLDDHSGKIAIAVDVAPSGKTRDFATFGWVQAKVDITDEEHTSCEIVDGEVGHLESSENGSIPMIPAQSGTGVKWAVVMLGGGSSLTHAFALEPSVNGAKFRYTTGSDPDVDITTARVAINNTGRFIAYGSQVIIKGVAAVESDTSTVIELVATEDGASTLGGYTFNRDKFDIAINHGVTHGWFAGRYLYDLGQLPSPVDNRNSFEVATNHPNITYAGVRTGDTVYFAISGGTDRQLGPTTTDPPYQGSLDFIPIGTSRSLESDGGGSADFCDPEVRTGTPTHVIGYETDCSNVGYYPPVAGPPGPKGDDGADSTVPGPKGDKGDKGNKGDDGAPGSDCNGMFFSINI